LPTEPHEIAISTDSGAAGAGLAAPSLDSFLAELSSAFLQPPVISTAAEHSKVSVFITSTSSTAHEALATRDHDRSVTAAD
jgi:hypothetical protein